MEKGNIMNKESPRSKLRITILNCSILFLALQEFKNQKPTKVHDFKEFTGQLTECAPIG